MTTQYLDEADHLADRIGVIDNGKLIAEGTSDELKTRLGGDVVEIHVDDADRSSTLEILRRIAGEEPKVERNGLTIPATRGSRTLIEVVREMDTEDIEPRDISLRKPTLDDVFLTLTGRKAEAETTADLETATP